MAYPNVGRTQLSLASARPKIFVAVTLEATQEISYALGDSVDLVLANTFDQAEKSLEKQDGINLFIVSYHFDELRPFRFIQLVKNDPTNYDTPLLLVHALPLHYPTPEVGAMREAYGGLGVTDVVSLLTLTNDYGRDRALEMFRETVASILQR